MKEKKCYATVASNKESHIFLNWEDCQNYIRGKSNIKYKSFLDINVAKSWIDKSISNLDLDNIKADVEKHKTKNIVRNKNDYLIYVDGSYKEISIYAGWAYVVLQNESIICQDSGVSNKPAISRNIDGELLATIKAVKWIDHYSFNQKRKINIIIHYDYFGIEKWVTGEWKAKSEISNKYKSSMAALMMKIKQEKPLVNIDFLKVKAHSNNKYNDLVDKLAQKAIEN